MFTIVFDSAETPMYEQLYRYIRAEIEQNRLGPGAKLPSKRKLAVHLKVSPVTVETAYAQLQAEGYIKSRPKQGYYVEPLEAMPFPSQTEIETITREAEAASASWEYDFKTNAVDIEAFPFATWASLSRKVLSEKQSELLKPIDPLGLYILRKEISAYLYRFRGVTADPGQIIVGAGAEYLISMIVKLLGRENIYGVENPGYHKINKIFKSCDSRTCLLPLDQYGLSVKALRETAANIVHVTPSHHFPLGVVMPVQRRTELITWAQEGAGRYILEDDYDSEFRFAGKPIPTLQGLTQSEQVIYLNTFAKSLAPSLRISYMVLPPALLLKYKKELSFYSSTVPSFEQYILAEFMKNGQFERHISRMKNIYKRRRDVLIQSIQQGRLGRITVITGQEAGMHLLLRVENGMTEQQLKNSAGQMDVGVYGLSEYYEQTPVQQQSYPENTVILGFSGMQEAAIGEAVRRLEQAWCQE